MFKKLILVAFAALATYSFGAASVVKKTSQKAVSVVKKTFKGSYVPGEVSEEIKQKCTQTISWRADDAAWLKDQFALAPSYSMIADSNRVAVRELKKIFEAGIDAQFSCVFGDTKEEVYVSVTFGKTEVTVVVRGKTQKAHAGLMEFFDVLVTKKENNAALYIFLKGAGVVAVATAVKVFGIDLWRQKRRDAQENIDAEENQDKQKHIAARRLVTPRIFRQTTDLDSAISKKANALEEVVKRNIANHHEHNPQPSSSGHKVYCLPCECDQLVGCSVWSMEGFKGSPNEDALDIYREGDWVGLAVYDGHAASREIADALAGVGFSRRLLPELIDLLKVTSDKKRDSEIAAKFLEFDNALREKKNGGSTAGICLFNMKANKGYFIVVGDSQPVVINRDGTFLTLEPHSGPSSGSYLARNGWPLDHAFGNFFLKSHDNCLRWLMKTEPKISTFNPRGAKFIVVASDGVYEHNRVEVKDTGMLVQQALERGFNPAEFLCKTACLNALKNSKKNDHTTAIVLEVEKLGAATT